ncbi:hypothetical protein [Cohnella silvisoli]|uniref:Uncharacterized protein n=1 Tax=Cohnella silvisoli TaxID=2873699 RepID=A0ABV1KYR2_9BACL|nr:hypothetical protein [Cohnella silvisoli]
MIPLVTTRQFYRAAAMRKPIYVTYDDELIGPSTIEELRTIT